MEKVIEIVSVEKEYIERAGDIAVKAWTPIRAEFKKLMGDDLYGHFFDQWQDKKRNSVITKLESGNGYIALVDGEVAGFITYHMDFETKNGEIWENAVDSDYKGMGIGTKLYEFVMIIMKENGMEYITVTTGGDDGHAPARRAYEKAGFEKFLPSVKYFKKL